MSLTHHPASENDFNEIYDLYMDTSSNIYLSYDPMSKENFRSIYSGLLQSGVLYVVKENNNIIATYQLVSKTDRQAHIYYLGGFTIKKNLQGKGLGKEILLAIRKDAIANGKKRIELTVDINNVGAIALYEKIGFLVEGVVKKNYRLASTGEYYDEYLMALILD